MNTKMMIWKWKARRVPSFHTGLLEDYWGYWINTWVYKYTIPAHLDTWRCLTWVLDTFGVKWGHRQRKLDPNYFGTKYVLFPINDILKKKRLLRHIMRNAHTFKIRCYEALMAELNEYLAAFLGSNTGNNFLR